MDNDLKEVIKEWFGPKWKNPYLRSFITTYVLLNIDFIALLTSNYGLYFTLRNEEVSHYAWFFNLQWYWKIVLAALMPFVWYGAHYYTSKLVAWYYGKMSIYQGITERSIKIDTLTKEKSELQSNLEKSKKELVHFTQQYDDRLDVERKKHKLLQESFLISHSYFVYLQRYVAMTEVMKEVDFYKEFLKTVATTDPSIDAYSMQETLVPPEMQKQLTNAFITAKRENPEFEGNPVHHYATQEALRYRKEKRRAQGLVDNPNSKDDED